MSQKVGGLIPDPGGTHGQGSHSRKRVRLYKVLGTVQQLPSLIWPGESSGSRWCRKNRHGCNKWQHHGLIREWRCRGFRFVTWLPPWNAAEITMPSDSPPPPADQLDQKTNYRCSFFPVWKLSHTYIFSVVRLNEYNEFKIDGIFAFLFVEWAACAAALARFYNSSTISALSNGQNRAWEP